MLGRSVGLTEAQLSHLGDEPLPAEIYSESEAAIVRYAQRSTKDIAIDAETYNALAQHFNAQQIIDICLTVGLSNMVNRFHATFLTDVDESTLLAVEAGDELVGGGVCPIPRPPRP
ncbi:MAG: carboxymuconolactone decarboxylase family protein [Ktedonobacteraceae bacterium]